ncbi:lipopolysaccharide biosynthesis protein [Bradyrhizobium sp. I1.7.5]|uniref:lipopolysaccharide biosynthesis protein n=1 Tax=Bradyrhizobium sp. I1.7.5 TaxID=3156363 RepID=UPI00339B2138
MISGGGPLISQLVVLATLPLLFRVYSPVDFGIWATIQAGAIASGSLMTLRYDLALVVERESDAANTLFYAVLCIIAAWSAIAGLALGVLNWLVVFPQVGAGLWCLIWLWTMLTALMVLLQGWLMRFSAFGVISSATIINTIGSLAIQLGGAHWIGGTGLVLGSALSQVVATGFLAYHIVVSGCGPSRAAVNAREMKTSLTRHVRFPQYSLPFTLMSLIRERAPIVVVGLFGSPAEVGIYSQAWRLVHFPSGLTGSAFRPVFFRQAAERGVAGQAAAVDRVIRCLLLVGAPFVALVLFGGDDLFVFVLGSRWSGVGSLSTLLIFPATLFAISNWMDRLLDVLGRQDLNLTMEVFSGLFSVGALWIGFQLSGGAAFYAVALQSVVLTASYVVLILICYGAAGWSRRSLFVSFGLAAAAGVFFYCLMPLLSLITSRGVSLLIGAVLCSVTAVGITLAAWRELR